MEQVLEKQDMLQQFLKDGYLIVDFYNDEQMDLAESLVRTTVESMRDQLGIPAADPGWRLKDYHLTLGKGDEDHAHLMEAPNRFITLTEELLTPIHKEPLTSLFGHYWKGQLPLITHWTHGSDGELHPDNACGFRCVRPGSGDIAGAHVDTYFGYGSRPEDAEKALSSRVAMIDDKLDLITAWVPVLGYDSRFSLRFAPRTHTIVHPVEAFRQIDGFITRACTEEYEAQFDYIRPDLKRGQAIVFHPNTLHGGSANLGNITRVSLEIRYRNPALALAA